MELTSQQRKIKYAVLCGALLVLHLLQNVGGLFPEIAGARCFLLLPAAVFISIGEAPFAAAMLGLFSGMLWDLTSLVHMGFNCLFFMFLCCITSALTLYIARDTFITNIILSSAAVIFYCFIYWVFFILIKGVRGAELTILSFYLPSAIYTIIISFAEYFVIKAIKDKVNHIKKQNFEG
ncbi:MAG: hypothetical protein IJ851_02845 [Eubacterium sp.]|nr:hypothetical protein [Eubacterium sp.]